jgi:imidazolonepropionase-like amidohydrolase
MAGAKFLGVDDRVGMIAEGKQADLILIDGRPDQEIESVANVTMVFRDGVAWDPAALIESVRGKVGR